MKRKIRRKVVRRAPRLDPLDIKVGGVPPSFRKSELEEMRLLIVDVRGVLERIAAAVVGNDALGSYGPVGSALNKLVKLDHWVMVGEARLDTDRRKKRRT